MTNVVDVVNEIESFIEGNFSDFKFFESVRGKTPLKFPCVIVKNKDISINDIFLDGEKKIKIINISLAIVVNILTFSYNSEKGENAIVKLLDDIREGLKENDFVFNEKEIKKRSVEVINYFTEYEKTNSIERNLSLFGGNIDFSTTIIE